jgi:hypothetical protein
MWGMVVILAMGVSWLPHGSPAIRAPGRQFDPGQAPGAREHVPALGELPAPCFAHAPQPRPGGRNKRAGDTARRVSAEELRAALAAAG